jgi:ribosomal protein S18 acetylase RimI-like enzyme
MSSPDREMTEVCGTIMNITIRPACSEDIPHLCDLLSDLFARETDFEPDLSKQTRGLNLLVNDQSGRSLVLVAVFSNEIIGMCIVQIVVSTAEGGPVGLVEDVIVRADCRGRGIGARLLTEAIVWSKTRKLSRLQLLADRDNGPALAFYFTCHWSPTSLICLRKHL